MTPTGSICHAAALLLLLVLAGCATERAASRSVESEVRAVLDQQAREWNAGNLAGFMETYAKSGQTRFQSGGDVTLGWQPVFDRYQRIYGDRTAMGTVSFSELEVTTLAPDAALVVGRWRLKRAQDEPSGLFTLLLRTTPEGWRIVHDHTSAAEKK